MFKRKGFHFLGSLKTETNQIIASIVKQYFNDDRYTFIFLFAGQMTTLTTLLKNNLLKNNKIIASEVLPVLIYAYSNNAESKVIFLNDYKLFNDFVSERKYYNLALILEVCKLGEIKDEAERKERIQKKYNKISKNNSELLKREEFYKKKLAFLTKIDFRAVCSYKLYDDFKDKENVVFFTFAPYFEKDYEKQVSFLTENIKFPDYCYVDYKPALNKEYAKNNNNFIENTANIVAMASKKLMRDHLIFNYNSQATNDEIIFVKKDNKIIEENFFYDLRQKKNVKITLPKGMRFITQEDYDNLTLKDELVSFCITDKTAINLKRVFTKKVNVISGAQFNTLQCIKKKDGTLLAIGIVRIDSKSRSNLFIKTDLVFYNIGTLAKLNACCFLNDEYNNNIKKRKNLVLDLKNEKITTAVFTNNFVSMKYRNIAKMIKKEEVNDKSISDCKYKLTYELNKNIWKKTINDMYTMWFKKWKK